MPAAVGCSRVALAGQLVWAEFKPAVLQTVFPHTCLKASNLPAMANASRKVSLSPCMCLYTHSWWEFNSHKYCSTCRPCRQGLPVSSSRSQAAHEDHALLAIIMRAAAVAVTCLPAVMLNKQDIPDSSMTLGSTHAKSRHVVQARNAVWRGVQHVKHTAASGWQGESSGAGWEMR